MRRLLALLFLLFPAAAGAEGWSAPIPFELDRNLIIVRVSVNGTAPGTFIFDTGAYSMLDARAADRLAMPRRRVGTTDGAGANQQPVYVPETPYRLALAGHEISPRQSLIVPLEPVERCFNTPLPTDPPGARHDRRLDGILGREFFERYIVEIDYPRRTLRLRDPDGWTPGAGAAPIPLELAPQHIFVRGAVTALDGRIIPARLLIDTGYAIGLALNAPFVDANALRPAPGTFETSGACGLGGATAAPSELAEIGAIGIGAATARRIQTEYSHSQQATAFDGFIGGGFLKDYRVTVAIARRMLLLERD